MKKKNLQKIRFATVRQAEKIAKDKIRKGTFRWLQAAAEDGYTHEKNILDFEEENSQVKRASFRPSEEMGGVRVAINVSFGEIRIGD